MAVTKTAGYDLIIGKGVKKFVKKLRGFQDFT
jgi:hypothetical protein